MQFKAKGEESVDQSQETISPVARRLLFIRKRADAAAKRVNRNPEEVTLIAVSKGQPTEAIKDAVDAGHLVFGENYAQGLKGRIASIGHKPEIDWHFIGHLQRNKVKMVVGQIRLFHGLDSINLADTINRKVLQSDASPMKCLVEVNIAGEGTKSGVSPKEAKDLIRHATQTLDGVRVVGLMAIPPYFDEAEQVRPYFQRLKMLRDELQQSTNTPLPELSMGMSSDFEIAIEEGASLIRVGTAIFGER